VEGLVSSTDAVVPSTDHAMLAGIRAGRIESIDVVPRLDMELTLGIVYLKGRTLIPAAERAFAIVRERLARATPVTIDT
jgi:hypothetical protein